MLTRRGFIGTATGAAILGNGLASLRGDDLPQIVAVTSNTGTARDVKPFDAACVISGKPIERGRQYGQQFESGIREFLDREIYSAFEGKTSTKDDLLRYAAACFKVIRAECPVIADELEGMAEGTGLQLEEHVLITLHEELYHRGVLPPVPHCTAVAVGPPDTRGETLVGQTWDWMPSVAGMSSMLEWRRDEGPSVLAYAFPGLWVGAGLNSAGLALCWTSADLGKPHQMPRVGLPAYVFLAHLMYQSSLDAVIDAAKRNRHAGWFTFVMADAAGRLVNVEGSPDGIEFEENTGRLLRVGFGTKRMTGTATGRDIPRHARCVTMERLLDDTRGATDVMAMQRNFGDPNRGICVGKNTIDLMVYDTTNKTAHLSRGHDYEIAWREFRFARG